MCQTTTLCATGHLSYARRAAPGSIGHKRALTPTDLRPSIASFSMHTVDPVAFRRRRPRADAYDPSNDTEHQVSFPHHNEDATSKLRASLPRRASQAIHRFQPSLLEPKASMSPSPCISRYPRRYAEHVFVFCSGHGVVATHKTRPSWRVTGVPLEQRKRFPLIPTSPHVEHSRPTMFCRQQSSLKRPRRKRCPTIWLSLFGRTLARPEPTCPTRRAPMLGNVTNDNEPGQETDMTPERLRRRIRHQAMGCHDVKEAT